jgi:putative membrane protein
MNDKQPEPGDRATGLAEQRTDLALQRTIVAGERTLMAWIRTSISMIGFGFTIYKFLQYLRMDQPAGTHIRLEAPRNFGLALIALGTLTLIGAILQHRQFLKRIGAATRENMWGLAMIVSILVVLIGVLAFAGILLRAGPF